MSPTISSPLSIEIVQALRSVIGDIPAPLHEPIFSGNEWIYLKECLDSTFVSSVGKFVDRLEVDLANFTGAKYAVAVVNGTAALHIALKLADVLAGDEVLMPTLTFVATANAVNYCGAIPHFVDCEYQTLGVDPQKLRDYLKHHTEQKNSRCINKKTGRVISAIVPMHTFGHPVDMLGLLAISRDFNIKVVEDAAESLGSLYQGQHTGTFGDLGTLSFNGNKTITTGGGGAILTNDPILARRAKHLTTTAKAPHQWNYYHDEVGYNYRMPNLNAALGCAQLESLDHLLLQKRSLFNQYQQAFSSFSEISLFKEPAGCKSNYWLQTLLLDVDHAGELDAILSYTNESGLMTRPAWIPMDELDQFKDCPKMDLEVAKSLSKRIINIPSSSNLAIAT